MRLYSWNYLHLQASPLFNYALIPAIVPFFSGNILFGLAYFPPSIIRSMDYNPIYAQLMSVRPYATTFVVSDAIAFLGDRWGESGYSLIFSGIIAMVGYILLLTSNHTSVLYGSNFLQTMGAFTSASAVSTWNVNNVQPNYKHSTAVGLGLAMANFGGRSLNIDIK